MHSICTTNIYEGHQTLNLQSKGLAAPDYIKQKNACGLIVCLMTIGLFFVYVADNQVSEINTCIYGSIIWLPHDVLMDKVHHASDVCWILKPGQLASFTIMFMKSNRSFNKHFWKHFTLSLHPCYFVYAIIIMLCYIIILNSIRNNPNI